MFGRAKTGFFDIDQEEQDVLDLNLELEEDPFTQESADPGTELV